MSDKVTVRKYLERSDAHTHIFGGALEIVKRHGLGRAGQRLVAAKHKGVLTFENEAHLAHHKRDGQIGGEARRKIRAAIRDMIGACMVLRIQQTIFAKNEKQQNRTARSDTRSRAVALGGSKANRNSRTAVEWLDLTNQLNR